MFVLLCKIQSNITKAIDLAAAIQKKTLIFNKNLSLICTAVEFGLFFLLIGSMYINGILKFLIPHVTTMKKVALISWTYL